MMTDKSTRILWVDDDGPTVFKHALWVLKARLNAVVHFASTTRTAIQLLREQDFNCVIADQLLPSDDPIQRPSFNVGVEFVRRLRDGTLAEEIGKNTLTELPILVHSAFLSDELESLLADQLYHDVVFMPKPMNTDELCEWIMTSSRTEGAD